MIEMRILPAFCLLALGCGAQWTAYGQNEVGANPCKGAVTPEAVVQAQVEAYNSHDVDGFADCYAENAAIRDLSGKRPELDGREKIRDHYQFLKQGPVGYGVDIVKRVVNGAIVVDLERPHGLPPGTPPRPDSIAVYEVRDGKIVNVWFPPH